MPRLLSIDSLPSLHDIEPATSLDDMATFVTPELTWDLSLPPHVDTERIVVNVSRLHKLHTVGSIASSQVAGYEGDTSSSMPTVVGINPDGTAIAGALSAVKKAYMAQSSKSGWSFQGERLGIVHSTLGKAFLEHQINRPEVASQVSDLVQDQGKSSEEAWAKCLDKALRESIRQGAYQHLMKSGDVPSVLLGTGLGLACLTGIGVDVAASQSPLLPAEIYAMLQSMPSIHQVRAKRWVGSHMPYFNRRFSIIPFGMQPDRYVAMNALTRVPSLIRSKQ